MARGLRSLLGSRGDRADATDLEAFGEAAWWSGKLEEAISLRERAYAAFTAAGDVRGAARMALALSWDYEGRGAFAVSGGWLSSAERLLEGRDESPEHARLLLLHAMTAMFAEGDYPKAIALLDETHALAGKVGNRDVQMLALSGKGRAHIKAGEIEKGLNLLDEATASAMCGDLGAHSAGLVYCITISSCQDLGDYRRAAEWTEAANRWCDKLDVTGFPGACRIHRAEVLRLRGDWPAAEAQAVAACEELRDFDQIDHRERALRDRRDPAPARRVRRSRGGVSRRERAGARPTAGPRAAPSDRGKGGRGRGRDQRLAREHD